MPQRVEHRQRLRFTLNRGAGLLAGAGARQDGDGVKNSTRAGSLAVAVICSAVLSGCSFSVSIGDPDQAGTGGAWPAAVKPGQKAVRTDAGELLWSVDDALTHRRGSTWENLELPTSGQISDSALDDLGVSLASGNAAHVSEYNDRFDFTVCVDRDGSGPSVSYRLDGSTSTASESTDACT